MIKFLTFDCYGTLIDWKKGIEDNFAECFNTGVGSKQKIFDDYVSLEIQEESPAAYRSYKEIMEATSIEVARRFGLEFSGNSGKSFADSITHWPAFSDSAPMLRKLGQLGYSRTILSNIDRDLLEGTIRNSNLEVDSFITAQEVKSYKPGKEHWLEFLRKSGAKKDEVLHVASSIYHDIIPASEIGIRTVWVNRYGERPPRVVKPDFAITNLSELVGVLERMT